MSRHGPLEGPGGASVRVFVYGTLKRGGGYHQVVAPFVRGAVEGWIAGALVDLGEYPGWVPGPGKVWGEVLRLEPAAEALGVLDEFEGCLGPGDPANLYDRVEVEVATAVGAVRAWAYRYRGATAGRPHLPAGRWPLTPSPRSG